MKKHFHLAFLFLVTVFAPSVKAQLCGTGPGMLCYGISNFVQCSTSVLTDCGVYPRCGYSGTISGYYCYNHCYNTGQVGSCGSGRVCLCIDRTPCSLCTSDGQNLSVCNDAGCGQADTTPPNVNITSPTSLPSFSTNVSPINVGGTASDNIVVAQVTYSNNRNAGFIGGSGPCTGISSWNASYINLELGQNIITVSATDGAGNIGSDVITMTYTPPSVPIYPSITLTENASSYNVNINDVNPLTEVAYAWGVMPNLYFLVPFANDSTPALSQGEKARYNYLISSLPAAWDNLTFNKHPLNFHFIEPFVLDKYSSTQNDMFTYVSAVVSKFNSSYPGTLKYPALYVILYPEPYFNRTYINIFGTPAKEVLAEVYFTYFNDAGYVSDEVMTNILLHEITHAFSFLPNNGNVPPGNKYFWLNHPAGFYGSGGACDENTQISDCLPYGSSESPTSTEGYYEVYSILSLNIQSHTRSKMQGRDPELSPLIEMALGIRSKYEDANFTYYEGFFNSSGFNLLAVHDYGISSRRLLDYDSVERQPSLYWDIRFDSQKTQLPNTTHAFSLQKSSQIGRALLVFASDYQYPGYFKAFSANARSNASVVGSIPSACIHKSDLNCDGCVSQQELSAFISRWYISNVDVTIKELMAAIGLWKSGCS